MTPEEDRLIPNSKTDGEGDAILSVDPEDIKRFWKVKPPWAPGNDINSACSPGADTAAVYQRWTMITTLTTHPLRRQCQRKATAFGLPAQRHAASIAGKTMHLKQTFGFSR